MSRPPLPESDRRTTLCARVARQTLDRLDQIAGEDGRGETLDRIIAAAWANYAAALRQISAPDAPAPTSEGKGGAG